MRGTTAEDGIYSVSGSLDGVSVGRRVVRRLTVRRFGPDTAEGLQPLAMMPELRILEVEHVDGVDLAPLAELELEILALTYARHIDLGLLARLKALRSLILGNLSDCRIPEALSLPETLDMGLVIDNDGAEYPGQVVGDLIDAIDWPRLQALGELKLRAGSAASGEPVEVDLGFLRQLPGLERLELWGGLRHRGAHPSPIEPPFDGLPPSLSFVYLDAWDPEPLRSALQQQLPQARVEIIQRYAPRRMDPDWTIDPPEHDSDPWTAMGSLWKASEGRHGDTEGDALEAAIQRLRVTDPELLARLDFDRDSSSTLIMSPSRADLERALGLLGLA